jgi:hypothetical protein
MNRHIITAMLLATALLLAACGSEDDLTPGHADTDPFAVSDADPSADAQLRRDFFARNGSYLLFNDTLSNGELLDLGYVMTAAENSTLYTYDYLPTTEEKQQATRFVEHTLLPHLGKKLRPFSFLLVNGIHKWTKQGTTFYQAYDDSDNPTSVTGVRSTAIAMADVLPMTADERQAHAQTLLKDILANAISQQSGGSIDAFKAYGKLYYGGVYDGECPQDEAENLALMNRYGFISQHSSYGFTLFGMFPTVAEDVTAYVTLALEATPEEVENTYASYPDIIEKYRLMVNIINELGYIK